MENINSRFCKYILFASIVELNFIKNGVAGTASQPQDVLSMIISELCRVS